MRIGIDCSCVAKPERTGVARYCASLLHQMPHVLTDDERVTLLYRVSRLKRRKWFERIDDPRFSVGLMNERLVRWAPRGIDVVHGPDLRIPVLKGVPAVSTVHDLSALDLPGIARESFRERKRETLQIVTDRASIILCISEFTEAALLTRFPAAEGRTRVVPLGLSERFAPRGADEVEQVRSEFGIRGRYVLFVGQISARKNLGPLLDAFIALRQQPNFRDLELVLAGPVQSGGDDVLRRVDADDLQGAVRFPGFVGDAQLPALYTGAEAFCFTGKAEGFGLPILEAMACGTAVIVARAGASESTAGGAAMVVEPDDAGELADALRVLLERGVERESLIARGFDHSAQFSWRETARRTVAAYRDAVRLGVPA